MPQSLPKDWPAVFTGLVMFMNTEIINPKTVRDEFCGDGESAVSKTMDDIEKLVMDLLQDALSREPVKDSGGNHVNGRILDVFFKVKPLLLEWFLGDTTSFEHHHFIQTFFPTEGISQFNKHAFLWKDMQGFYSTTSGGQLYDMNLRIILKYYGMNWNAQVEHFKLNGRRYPGGHHNLRISRILESLRLMSEFNPKYRSVRKQVYYFLKEKHNVDDTCLRFWKKEMQK